MESTTTRSRLLEAASVVFLAQGYATASMDQVRHQAGVSNGSLYHHFPTKALLADALYAHTLRDFHGELVKAITDQATAESGVKGLIRAYISWVERHPDRARLLHVLRRSADLGDASAINAANADGFGALAQWIAQRVKAGDMRDLPFALWMALVFAPVMSLTPSWTRQSPTTVSVSPKVRAALEQAAWLAVAP